jgi:hypothetical protein
MKTSIQHLIDAIEYRETILPELYKTEEYTAGYELALTWLKVQCEYHLLLEKDNIVKAAAQCHEDMFGTDGTAYGEKYYDETFNPCE